MGWVQFDDLKEAVVLDSHAPHTTEWVIIWLLGRTMLIFASGRDAFWVPTFFHDSFKKNTPAMERDLKSTHRTSWND